MFIITAVKDYIENLFSVPLVAVGQRWQWYAFYDEEINPFDSKSGKRFILTILEVKDGWMQYRWEDGSIGSDKVSKVYHGNYIKLANGEKE